MGEPQYYDRFHVEFGRESSFLKLGNHTNDLVDRDVMQCEFLSIDTVIYASNPRIR